MPDKPKNLQYLPPTVRPRPVLTTYAAKTPSLEPEVVYATYTPKTPAEPEVVFATCTFEDPGAPQEPYPGSAFPTASGYGHLLCTLPPTPFTSPSLPEASATYLPPAPATQELRALRTELTELRQAISQLAANGLLTAAKHTPLLPGQTSNLPAVLPGPPGTLQAPLAPVMHRNVTRTVLHGPDNTSVPVAATEETMLLHPDGSREYLTTTHRYRDAAGRQLSADDQILACPHCYRQTLTAISMRNCTTCQQPACLWCTTVTENEEKERSYYCPTHTPRRGGGFFETILGIAAYLLS